MTSVGIREKNKSKVKKSPERKLQQNYFKKTKYNPNYLLLHKYYQ